MSQEHKTPQRREDEDDQTEDVVPADQEHLQELSEETDAILDDIDEALEENADRFVAEYIQQGGQ